MLVHKKIYSPKFFEHIREMSSGSALAAVPKILDVYSARSVIDVGCGIGAWLKPFADRGVKKSLDSTVIMSIGTS